MNTPGPIDNPLRELSRTWRNSRSCVRFVTVLAAGYLGSTFFNEALWRSVTPTDLLWPVSWLPQSAYSTALTVATVGGFIAACLGAWKLHCSAFRLVAAGCLLLHLSMIFSFGQIRHNHTSLLWLLGIFALIPGGSLRSGDSLILADRITCVRIVGFGQLLFLLFYSMAGLFKVAKAVEQLASGQVSLFHPEAAARIVSDWLIKDSQGSLLAEFVIGQPSLSFLGLLIAVMAETVAVFAVFNRRLQTAVGTSLLIMHVGILLTLNIGFYLNMLLLLRLVMFGPCVFHPGRPPRVQ